MKEIIYLKTSIATPYSHFVLDNYVVRFSNHGSQIKGQGVVSGAEQENISARLNKQVSEIKRYKKNGGCIKWSGKEMIKNKSFKL